MTVVLICTVSPASESARMAGMVSSKCPGMPRTPSWVSGRHPSRLIETALIPESTILAMVSGVSWGVTDGERAVGMPRARDAATRSQMSGRSRQSPPVSTRIG